MLGVLDAEAPIPRAVFLFDSLEDIQLIADGAVPDSVHDHMQPRLVGA